MAVLVKAPTEDLKASGIDQSGCCALRTLKLQYCGFSFKRRVTHLTVILKRRHPLVGATMMGTWTTFNTPKIGDDWLYADTMLLLTDGSVLIHQRYLPPTDGSGPGIDGRVWMRLTPDVNGNYDKGQRSKLLFPMINQRQYFASGITIEGKVYVVGGETSDDKVHPDDSPLGEIFDPLETNPKKAWSPLKKPSEFDYIQGDVPSSGLKSGHVLFGSITGPPRTADWDPSKKDLGQDKKDPKRKYGWKEVGAGTKDAIPDEETWTLLPDGSVLTVEVSPSDGNLGRNPAERYIPDEGRWIPAGFTGVPLVVGTIDCTYTPAGKPAQNQSVNVSEIGPALLLADGRLFAIGATGHTAIFTPSTNTWAAGPDFGADTGGNSFTDPAGSTCSWTSPSGLQGACDAPAVLLPGGQVLCCAGNFHVSTDDPPGTGNIYLDPSSGNLTIYNVPTIFYEYDPALPQNGLVPLPNQPSMGGDNWVWMARLLLLPNGQVLYSTGSNTLGLYQPSPAELTPAVPRPTITNFCSADFPSTLTIGTTFKLTGQNLNGFSQANSYGDDAQMATNFPLVRVKNASTQAVVYLRTSNFTSLGVAVAGPVTCDVAVSGNGLTDGTWELVVVANAVPSLPVTVEIAQRTA
jgi:hypothetical protein